MLSSFSLILTDDCNFRCSYCYQEKDGLSLDAATARRAVEFLFPRFDSGCTIMFHGGEPLLRTDTIREVVAAVEAKVRRTGKKVHYSISTNGSLLDDDTLDFFERNRFTVLLSFDGRAQDKGRKKGSYPLISGALGRLLDRPGIELLTNSVFSAKTVGDLSASIQDIVARGVRDAQISFSTHLPWGRGAMARLAAELSDLRRSIGRLGRKRGLVPVANFRTPAKSAIFGCLAGEDRLALSPDGRLWGCHLFYDLHRSTKSPATARYSFGRLDSFIAHHEKSYRQVLANYSGLRMDYFHTPGRCCGLCPDVHDCVICPVDAALSSGMVGRITSVDCRIRKMVMKEKRLLWKDLSHRGAVPARARTGASGRTLNA